MHSLLEGTRWENVGIQQRDEDRTSNDSVECLRESQIDQSAEIIEGLIFEALQYENLNSLQRHGRKKWNGDYVLDDGTVATTKTRLNPNLKHQIKLYISCIASRYHRVGFHSFDHACHVMLSASKIVYMLRRCQRSNDGAESSDSDDTASDLQDPWLHVAIPMAALIHDVDHRGVPNKELAAVNHTISVKYGSEECMSSYAEWNSVDIGLGMLENCLLGYCDNIPEIDDLNLLREIFNHQNGRLRDMVRDLVLCTDIASAERRKMNMQRWENAFSSLSEPTAPQDWPKSLTTDATQSVADQIMQAADVSHTMQHFSTFLRWNERLYNEMLSAFRSGQSHVPGFNDVHPADN
eukprot:13194904-Ditylum_brightwellii.AAC.1